nr:hypothetical protein [Lachnospiraceae bacterium]
LTDKLPANAYVYDHEKLYNKVLKTTDKDRFIDLRKLLKEKSKEDRVYFHTDHHWTLNGAYEGYLAYTNYLETGKVQDEISEYKESEETLGSDKFFGTIYSKVMDSSAKGEDLYIQTDIPEGIKVTCDGKEGEVYDEEKLKEKDKYAVFFGGNYAQMTIENPSATSDKTLLVIKDSFANSMLPYMLSEYKKIDVLDLRYYMGSIKALIAENKYSEELILYEMSNFAEDRNMYKLAM